MKIIFMGTPEFAVPTLTEIVSTGHEVVAVYTRAPKPAGRGQAERRSPVHEAAEGFGIPVFTPRSLKQAPEQEVFASLDADVAVVVAYGLILPKPILDAPRLGCLNLHGSLLPRWRGAAPIQRAVMAGDARTGVMVMQMDEGLDTGPVGLIEEMPIGPDMTSGELHDKMMLVGADLMGRALAALDRGSLHFTPQPEAGVTYAAKIDKAEARIDWSRPAAEVHNQIRGLSPFPGAWFELSLNGAPTRVKALRSTLVAGQGEPGTILPELTIVCGSPPSPLRGGIEGGGGSVTIGVPLTTPTPNPSPQGGGELNAVRLTAVQREGKGAMDAATFLRGAGALPERAS